MDDLHLGKPPLTITNRDVFSWMFPAEFCQSTIDGRNGSNTCGVISLAATHAFLIGIVILPAGIHSLHWMKYFYLCMRPGNTLYDNARHSLPHLYLTAPKAASLFSDYAVIKVQQPFPFRLHDQHPPATLENQLIMLTREGKRCTALYIYDNKTVLFLITENGTMLFVDSHSHPPYDTTVTRASKLSHLFVSCFAEAALLNPNLFGNFTRIDVPVGSCL